MFHSLGVNMGPTYWGEHFEAADLSAELRTWWTKPQSIETFATQVRVEYLKPWFKKQPKPITLATGNALNAFLTIDDSITNIKGTPLNSK
jgi:hypothetical protein